MGHPVYFHLSALQFEAQMAITIDLKTGAMTGEVFAIFGTLYKHIKDTIKASWKETKKRRVKCLLDVLGC